MNREYLEGTLLSWIEVTSSAIKTGQMFFTGSEYTIWFKSEHFSISTNFIFCKIFLRYQVQHLTINVTSHSAQLICNSLFAEFLNSIISVKNTTYQDNLVNKKKLINLVASLVYMYMLFMRPYAEHLHVRVSEHTIKSQSSTIACLIGHWKSKQNICVSWRS